MATQLIASDDNNPEFVGAHNPDSRLNVRFYTKTLLNEFESKKQERPIYYDADFVKIELPGDRLNNIDTFVNDTHKQRFPLQWARYQNSKQDASQIVGTPIEQWPLVGRDVAEELRALKFYTVDSIANASDAQLQAIGMRAGMQPHTFREKASQWLKRADADAALQAATERESALKQENEDTRRALAELQAQMQSLQGQKGKPGPKPKVTEAA